MKNNILKGNGNVVGRLWGVWCSMVDEHNEKQTYATYEECWSYYTIFVPFIMGALAAALLTVGMLFTGKAVTLFTPLNTFIAVSALFSVGLLINWTVYSK